LSADLWACGEGEGPGSVDGNEGFDAGPNHLREIVVGDVLGVGEETRGDRPTLGERNTLQRGGEVEAHHGRRIG